jgi:hypothetical protein
LAFREEGGRVTIALNSSGGDCLNRGAERYGENRFFLKDTVRQRIDFSRTGQSRGVRPSFSGRLLGVDGEEEFTVYIVATGK